MKEFLDSVTSNTELVSRKNYHWALGALMIVTLSLGWKYPVLGYVVPITMVAGIVVGVSKGRFVCGNVCPRGTFFDTFFQFIGGSRPIPRLLFNPVFRWIVLGLLMGFMIYRIAENPADPMHWGMVFWTMCFATTMLAFVLGIAYRSRSWCAFCPVGTMANAIGGQKYQLRIASSSCNECGICDKSCPMGFSIMEHRKQGSFPDRDCLKCSSCEARCPKQALSFPE
jgi:polyferredoxin